VIHLLKQKNKIENKIHLIQAGDKALREVVINDYFPFVIQILSDVLNTYIEIENNPYLSFGLEAFNKAIDKYDSTKGSFLTFAKYVIKNKVYDELRKEKKLKEEATHEDNNILAVEENVFINYENANEINYFKEILLIFNLTIEDLIKESPKHKTVRKEGIRAGTIMSNEPIMMKYLYEKKQILRKQLAEKTGLSIKKIRYNRSFIIAVAIALDKEFSFICDYIKEVERSV